MIVMVMVDGQARGVLTEQFDERRIAADLLRMPGTTHVAVQAHHRSVVLMTVQVVGDHQHAATVAVAQAGYQAVQLGLAGHIHALHGFIEHQQLRFA